MINKKPICTERIRRIPKQFSWVDHRLVRERYIDSCTHQAAALYLFLLTVGDSRGLSHYGEASLMTRLAMDPPTLYQARENLIQVGLVAFKKPLYQVLALDPAPPQPPPTPARTCLEEPLPIGLIFKQIMKGRP